jgi:GTP-binding protein
MFLDEVEIRVESGKGGDGAATFHREKHVPLGGPNGNDGGRGGDIVLIADRHLTTLYNYRGRKGYRAEDGAYAKANQTGKDGKSLELKVPVGTVVTDLHDMTVLVDLSADGMRYVVSEGGKGGLGNLHFTNSVRQAPSFAQKGAPPEVLDIRLELKMLADAGLIGMPNAGKSTLLSQCTAAKPKIGDYPFTTIIPNLGVAAIGDRSFVIADLPGLIEGASEGHGLGDQFLKHTERTKVLVHLVDAFPLDETDPFTNYETIENELKNSSEALYNRPRVIALNKADLESLGDLPALVKQFEATGREVFVISGATGQGVEPLLWATLKKIDEAADQDTEEVAPVLRAKHSDAWDVIKFSGGFELTGRRITRLVSMTNLKSSEAVHYLHLRLQTIGVINKLKKMGAKEGDRVVIGDFEFRYVDWE